MRIILRFIVAALFAVPAFGGPGATLAGRVTNTNGQVIRDVRVEVTNVETEVISAGQTNKNGLYYIPNLPPGMYRMTVRKFAYRTIVRPEIELVVQDLVTLNFSMELGSIIQSITVEGGAPLVQANPSRGGNFQSGEVSNLPLVSLSPLSLARTLPGISVPAGSNLFTTLSSTAANQFSVNGQRVRSNNYMLDSTENNDFVFTGVAQPFDIADAVEEVSVQTGSFGAEFGRGSGGIFNVVTKSGTNGLRGTVLWRYQSHRFNSVSNLDKLNGTIQPAFNRNVYGFTAGGPIRRHRTFFFAAFQQGTQRSTRNASFVVPTASTVSGLRAAFSSNPRLDLYLNSLGSLRGVANPFSLQLGADPNTGVDRGYAQFGVAAVPMSASSGGPQGLARVDHSFSERHRLAFRYIYDWRNDSPAVDSDGLAVFFPGFALDESARNQNFLITDQYSFSPLWTNEFRFSYVRQSADGRKISTDSVPLAQTLPRIVIPNVSAPGIGSGQLQDQAARSFLFQETQTKLNGRHTFRFGAEILRQLATQTPFARRLGELDYTDAPALGYSAFANFLDDYSGPQGRAQKDFGATAFHPNSWRHTYFFQDAWLPFPSLSLTLGLRYENFGQPANALRYPAFAGFDPAKFLEPNRVDTDNNNFGPAFGFAWSAGDKTVVRGGFQIHYDAPFTQAVSLLLATSTPNAISTVATGSRTGRGDPNWFGRLPAIANAPSITDQQRGALEKSFRNAYTERWSVGFQRQLSPKLLLDGSYVGSESHKLATWSEMNPAEDNGQRLYPEFGSRRVRTSQGNASYHSMQWRIDRRFSRGMQVVVSYTWSKSIDSTSEGVGTTTNQAGGGNLTSVPIANGGLRLDRGLSDYDRAHQASIVYRWDLPSPLEGFARRVFGGWSLTGIASFQSGAPFTVLNGVRRSDAGGADRADIGNPKAPLKSRARINLACPNGYADVDTEACVKSSDVHWIQGTGAPNASTVGRNTLRTGAMNNLDLSLTKSFRVGEQQRLEFRWEAFNALNHQQFVQVPQRTVVGTPASRFLNRDNTDSGTRSMWVQIKLLF